MLTKLGGGGDRIDPKCDYLDQIPDSIENHMAHAISVDNLEVTFYRKIVKSSKSTPWALNKLLRLTCDGKTSIEAYKQNHFFHTQAHSRFQLENELFNNSQN